MIADWQSSAFHCLVAVPVAVGLSTLSFVVTPSPGRVVSFPILSVPSATVTNMSDDRPAPNPLAPWPTLAERDVDTELEPELYEGVPPHLLDDLVAWAGETIRGQDQLVRSVLNRFRVSWSWQVREGVCASHAAVLLAILKGGRPDITSPRPLDPLSVLNALIALHPDWENQESPGYSEKRTRTNGSPGWWSCRTSCATPDQRGR